MVSRRSRAVLTLALEKQNGLGIDSCISVGFGSVRALRARWRFAWWGSTRSHNMLRVICIDIERRRPLLWTVAGSRSCSRPPLCVPCRLIPNGAEY